MNDRFSQRVVLITGGGSGIGRACALRFASEGARVVVADNNPVSGCETCQQIEAAGGHALFSCADVTRNSDAEKMVVEAEAAFGRLDVLFTAAGIGGGGTVVNLTEEDWDRMLDLDLKGVFLSSKYAIPALRKVGGGAIVHTSSTGGLRGDWGSAAFSAAKAGVINLTRHMAVAHGPENIRVNCICPGVIETPLTEKWLSAPDVRERVIRRHPLGRLGRAEEVAAVVAFLASDEASFVNGAIVYVDGGSLAMGR